MAMLEVSNLEAAYGPVQALRGVSLAVERGTIVALLGANGAGKTTVLKVISGVVDPRSGGVRFDDQDIAGLEPDRIVGMGLSQVPEGREVFRVRTVHENLILGAYRRKDHAAIQADIERMYGYFPILRERRSQRAGLLSGGQQQMLAISRALMARPRLLLLDEPSLGLSPLLVREIFAIVRRLREEGITILLVEQNAAMALEVADYGYIMEVGRIALEGDAASLRENPTVREFYLGIGQDSGSSQPGPAKRKPLWR
ncbi:MAG: ABC transporter ATP-binding protein [Rhodoferax sp.]|nr:ABC transporter ATP-binding protein [Rhodoferax sp.]